MGHTYHADIMNQAVDFESDYRQNAEIYSVFASTVLQFQRQPSHPQERPNLKSSGLALAVLSTYSTVFQLTKLFESNAAKV